MPGSLPTHGASASLFSRARKVIPGGVNSPVRAFKAVGGTPLFIERGRGSRIYSADGQEYIDFCGSWGPLILGHAHPVVVDSVQRAATDGVSFGACSEREVDLAELLCENIPYLEHVRLVNSGTEACMSAIRLARGFTGRDKILKFDGCYHGHADALLVSAGSGLLTATIASSSGVPANVAKDTLVVPYNDLDAVEDVMAVHGKDIAAIIVEPVAGNMGLVRPLRGFLEGLRSVTQRDGALLIFDEVITGFRLGPTAYGALHGVTPDLTCLGKIIGGGMPLGAFGGSAEIMERLAPLGTVYQAGTLSGNPIAVAAGASTIRLLIEKKPYPEIERLAEYLPGEIAHQTDSRDCGAHCARIGGMFTVFCGAGPILNLADSKRCDTRLYARFFNCMLQRGIYLPPSQFEACFISAAHSPGDMRLFREALDAAFPGETLDGNPRIG